MAIFRFAAVGALIFGLLTFWGCRMTWLSAGASAEAVPLDLTTYNVGDEMPDNHVDLENYYPLLERAFETESNIYIPIAPLAVGAKPPSNDFEYKTLGYQTKIIGMISKSTDTQDQIASLLDAKGMYLGSCGDNCSTDARNVFKRTLSNREINDVAVVELGREPSTFWGILTLLAGIIGFVGSGALTYFGFGAKDGD